MLQRPGAALRCTTRPIRGCSREIVIIHPICNWPTLCVRVSVSQRIPGGEDLRTDKGRMGLSNPDGFSCRASGDPNVWWCWRGFVRAGLAATPQESPRLLLSLHSIPSGLPGGIRSCGWRCAVTCSGRDGLLLGDATGTSTIVKSKLEILPRRPCTPPCKGMLAIFQKTAWEWTFLPGLGRNGCRICIYPNLGMRTYPGIIPQVPRNKGPRRIRT